MENFMNWFGRELQTAGSIGRVGFVSLIILAIVWLIMTIHEHM